jgi:phosphatidylglycerol:prolipoprotein diacylglycerol transferase
LPSIPWTYPAIMLAAPLTCSWLLRRSQAALPLTATQKIGIGIGAFCGAMLGAKLPFVLSDWEGMLSGAAWLSHGKTIMCGLVGGYFGVELAKWSLEIRVKTGDTFAAPVAIAVAIGRIGCFHVGCCFGVPTQLPWGVVFPSAGDDPPLARHPTQLYETAFHLLAAVILIWLGHRGLFRGQLIKLYIMTYLIYRFITEFIRPEPRIWWGMTGYQWSVFLLLPLFAMLWYRDRRVLKTAALEPADGPPTPTADR